MYEIDPARVFSPREDENPSFDLGPRSNPHHNNNNRPGPSRNTPAMDLDKMNPEDIQSVIKLKPQPKQTWEPDVKSMISTKKWLSTYGLRRNRLSLDQILGSIGFKHSDDYDHSLKKPVCSRYGEGMFTRYPRKDGTVYNVNLRVSKEKIQQIENSLLQAIALYKRRIEWLTSESRRLFGVIEEHCITIVLDIKTNSPSQFDHCRNAIIRVLEEQVSQIAKFNIIRAAEDQIVFSSNGAIPVCHDSLNNAIDWLSKLDSVAATTNTSACEGLVKAFDDRKVEAVYFFSEGSSANTSMELLLSKVRGGPLPVHTVAFNNSDSTTIKFLKEVAQATGGRFHAFAFNKLESDVSGTSGYNMDNKILQGGVPPGAGARDDVVKMWAELEEARNILVDIQQLVKEAPSNGKSEQTKSAESLESSGSRSSLVSAKTEQNEQYMSSQGWLSKRGLKARKLDLYDVLATCSFRHCDGVIDVKAAPEMDFTDAESRNKLINAKYCDRFCHVQWKDGSVKHVHVTADVHREYEKKMASAIDDFQRRIDWLQQGSRELFGTIIEDQVYILIDVSNSMQNHLGLVKEKLYRLMQEQLRHKSRFNLVRFGSKANGWRDRMLEVNETNLQSAWQWVRNLSVSGSTNSLAALKMALSDPNTQAVYLLTDGRPDHPPKTILAQVQLKEPIPIHTISFNCNDSEANDFLALLAHDTGGRYHYYSDNAMIEHRGPTPYESEDVHLLKEEVKKGRDDLKKLADLRVQCAMLDWGNSKNRSDTGCGKDHGIKKRPSSASGLRSASQVLSRDSSSPTPPRLTRPMSAQSNRRPMSALSTSHEHCRPARGRTTTYPPRPNTPTRRSLPTTRPNVAYHNKTSWLRLRGSLDGWAVPETRAMLAKQQERYVAAVQDLAQTTATAEKKKRKKKKKDTLTMSSKMWLKKHGLAAKNLTIYDALGNTMVKQRAKYVPILDKHVVSQVFNEILPLAHVTGNRQEISLINPSGIDLQGYEEKLEKAIELYHKRLDRIVWNGLSREEREQFNEDDEPVSFVEHRKDCIEALDRLGWPVSERNILLLEDEIEKGRRYLRHSRAIRRAVKAKFEDKSPERPTSSSSSPSRSVSNTPRASHLTRRKSQLEADRSASSHSDASKHGSSSSASSAESEDEERSKKSSDAEERDHHHHSNSSDEEEEGGYKELVARKSRPGTSKKTTKNTKKIPTERSRPKMPSIRLPVGSKVIARSNQDGFYYPGTVARVEDPRHVKIRFQSQGREVIPTRFVIQMGGARPSPILKTGDSVLARVSKHYQETWVPGIIQFGPADDRATAKFYTVVLYNYKKMNISRNGVVRIPHERYNFTVRYICSISDPPQPEPTDEPTIVDLEEPNGDDDETRTPRDGQDDENDDDDEPRTPRDEDQDERNEEQETNGKDNSTDTPSAPVAPNDEIHENYWSYRSRWKSIKKIRVQLKRNYERS
ncbi:von Willebrand factor A domain-containing protein 3B-like isoform X2 [Amphiura filiformis]|uniref:von Willebrand factor A domain-containing protein 3B-like isoform X2 n=1 Tax=Amphiura filiformis TaxID=82378 RepID=UPI003B21DEAD